MNSEIRPAHEFREQKDPGVGRNTKVMFRIVRHSQKSSAEVLNTEITDMSSSDLSTGGEARARTFGKQNLTGLKLSKAYATSFDRTKQTLEQAFIGAGITDVQILQEGSEGHKAFFALPEATRSPEFLKKYKAAMEEPKAKYLAEHFPDQKYEDLNLDQQEEIMEYANEFAVELYLASGNQRPDPDTLSPREEAAKVAFKLNRLINLADYVPNGKEVDLLSGGHKTSTESLLIRILETHGQPIQDLRGMGGSLGILDSWELSIENDGQGNKTVNFTLRRENGETQNFGINLIALKELAAEGRRLLGERETRLDRT